MSLFPTRTSLRNKVFCANPCTVHYLKMETQHEMLSESTETLQTELQNFLKLDR